ncbi:hypothetical protein [Micromonospora sp. WMMD998]|uniref:hypothetical protein n=1 Tax=Micromonospora sp. WMMD998 TaxID=3016092 RepID=UPI00249B310C|nr:hypothetical protein [Micromonospora sp. WMMD998]WFE39120.1 hypothetical protein O7619_12065 [Micromonospora sp. WMMD998]
MSQPPFNPYPGTHPPPPQQQPGGYPPPQPPYGGDQLGAPPKKKFGAGKILLIVLAAVLVLCLGGGLVFWLAAGDEVKDVVAATRTRVVEPTTLGGRPKVSEPQLQSLASQMKTDLSKDVPNATSTAGAFYGDPAKKDLVMIVGVSGVIADPKKEMADAITAITPELGAKEFKAVDAGPLGGDAECGDGKAQDIPVGVCVWADKGSLGMVVAYFKSATELQSEFVDLRGEVETKD